MFRTFSNSHLGICCQGVQHADVMSWRRPRPRRQQPRRRAAQPRICVNQTAGQLRHGGGDRRLVHLCFTKTEPIAARATCTDTGRALFCAAEQPSPGSAAGFASRATILESCQPAEDVHRFWKPSSSGLWVAKGRNRVFCRHACAAPAKQSKLPTPVGHKCARYGSTVIRCYLIQIKPLRPWTCQGSKPESAQTFRTFKGASKKSHLQWRRVWPCRQAVKRSCRHGGRRGNAAQVDVAACVQHASDAIRVEAHEVCAHS